VVIGNLPKLTMLHAALLSVAWSYLMSKSDTGYAVTLCLP